MFKFRAIETTERAFSRTMFVKTSYFVGMLFYIVLLFAVPVLGDESENCKNKPRVIIEQSLAKKIDWNFKDAPLGEIVESLKKELQIPIYFDANRLSDLGIESLTPLSFQHSGISAKTGLKYLLRQLGLSLCTYGEVLLITTPEEVANTTYAEVYDVTDLVTLDHCDSGIIDYGSLAELICISIKPTSWEGSGPAPLYPVEIAGKYALVFEQTEEVHQATAELLAELRAIRHRDKNRVKSESPPLPSGQELKSVEWNAIRTKLDQKVSLHYSKTPLAEVAADLQKISGIAILLDERTIRDLAENFLEIPITFDCRELELRTALNLMLRQIELNWTINDELLLISTHEEADNRLLTWVYDVSDLPAFRNEKGETAPDFTRLCNAISRGVSPSSWNDSGGPGSIREFEIDGIQALVVSQTWHAHESIRALLNELRKLRNGPLTKEEIEKLPLESSKRIPLPPSIPESGTKGGGFQ